MGISGLLPLLKDAQEEIHISKYKGKTLGVDAYVWLHRGAYGCAQQLALGQQTTSYVKFAMNKVNMLKYHGITPFIVFDGGPLPAKAKTETERAARRNENLNQAKMHLRHGRTREARDYFTKCVDVTPAMAYQFIKALRAEGVDYIVAPYEADAQLAYLERRGRIQGIITEDSDLLVFGCQTVLYKLNDEGRCIELLQRNRTRCKGLQLGLFTDALFRQMAILSGCDYLDSIPGMGLKTAHKLLRQCGSVARALSAARMEGMKVPPNYQKDFEMAEKTFVYQRVFHRSTTTGKIRMVTLSPCEGQSGVEDQDCIGPLLPDFLLDSIAKGDVDPITKQSLVEKDSYTQISRSKSTSSLSTVSKPKWIRETQSAGQKTLDTFFTRDNQRAREEQIHFASTSISSRKPLAAVTNTVSSSAQNEPASVGLPTKIPTEKSKYFTTTQDLASSPLLDQQAQFDDLASFTPTQKTGSFIRSLSTDSGEISSPASSSVKRTRKRLLSSPLIEIADDTSSPNTSPTLIRPRNQYIEGSKSPVSPESEIDDEDTLSSTARNNLLAQFAYQQTPIVTRGNNLKRTVSSIATGASGSNSSNKKRFIALLQFQNDEEDDIFNETYEQTTPLVKRSHSESSTRPVPLDRYDNIISRPYSLKRVQTSNK